MSAALCAIQDHRQRLPCPAHSQDITAACIHVSSRSCAGRVCAVRFTHPCLCLLPLWCIPLCNLSTSCSSCCRNSLQLGGVGQIIWLGLEACDVVLDVRLSPGGGGVTQAAGLGGVYWWAWLMASGLHTFAFVPLSFDQMTHSGAQR